MVVAAANAADLRFLSGLIEAGQVRPVVDRTYPLGEVPDAIRYLNAGRARGKLAIAVSGADAPAARTAPAVTTA